MNKLCQNISMFWWSLLCISCFTLFGNGGAEKGLTLGTKGRPYFKEEAIVKTFEFDGDIIDCVDIYKQPAFDHPLLKNHTIQMKPTFIPERSTGYSHVTISNGSTVEDTHLWLFKKSCPKGSIPITRMPYMDGYVKNYAPASDLRMHHPRYPLPRYPPEHGGTKGKKFDNHTSGHEHAAVRFTGEKLYGARAKFNVQHPSLEGSQEFSVAQMWIASEDKTTILEAGWAVFPQLYRDRRTRFFTFWMNNNRVTTCYNLQCPGFFRTNHDIPLDIPLEPLSVYGGQQYELQIEIFQDINSKNWWLRMDDHLLGYWPKSIVPKLADGAHILGFGGEILNKRVSGRHTSTQMGSGHFAREGIRKAAYIRNVMIMEDLHWHSNYTSPVNLGTPVITHPNCYDLQLTHHTDLEWGYNFFYGGPGRSGTCI